MGFFLEVCIEILRLIHQDTMQTEYVISPLFKRKETAEEADTKQTPQTNGERMTGPSKRSFSHQKDLAKKTGSTMPVVWQSMVGKYSNQL